MSRSRLADAPVDPAELDLGYLAQLVGSAISEAVQTTMQRGGYTGLRTGHGYFIQQLIDSEPTIGELAERVGVTQQAASKVIAELATLGYLEVAPDPGDARIRRVRLSPRGRAAVTASRHARLLIERKLAAHLGARTVERTRATLVAALDALGATPMLARRVAAR